ncbi:MAG: hypothetical protein HQ530_01885 [Parcubacteria group bacterium]|nr:hypothetical protein [Parcubacteria group bacterium]
MLDEKNKKDGKSEKQEDRERLSQFFNLLLQIDRRVNPELYEKEEKDD